MYYVIAPAEASSNLSRFDGVRYGHRAATYADLADMYKKTRAEGFGAEVKRRILVGTYVLSHGYYDAYYLKAQKVRRLIADDFARAYAQCDVIMGPTAPIGGVPDRRRRPTIRCRCTWTTSSPSPRNLTGAPAHVDSRAASTASGLPIGLQLQGDYLRRGEAARRRAPVPAGDRLASARAAARGDVP